MLHKSTKKFSLIHTSVYICIISIITLLFSFLKDSIFAYLFGTTNDSDAFVIAVQIPVIIFSIISSILHSIVIPMYSDALFKDGNDSAKEYVSSLMNIVVVISVILIIICEIFPNQIVKLFAPGVNNNIYCLAVKLFRFALPTILISEIIYINLGILNVHKEFILPALGTSVLNITYTLVIFFFAKKIGIFSASIGIILGYIVEYIYLYHLRKKYIKIDLIFNLKNERIKKSAKLALPVLFNNCLTELNKLIDRIIASYQEQGTISSFNYASKISSAVSTIMLKGIVSVLYPEFSKLISQNKIDKLSNLYTMSFSILTILFIPIIFGCYYLKIEIVSMLFYRGSFTYKDVCIVSNYLVWYIICLLFSSHRLIGTRMFLAKGDTKSAMINSAYCILINIIFNFILSYYWGAIGLVIATTLATAIASFLLLIKIGYILNNVSFMDIVISYFKSLLSSVIMLFVLSYLSKFKHFIIFGSISQTLNIFIYILLNIFIGFLIYIICHLVLSTKEVKFIFHNILNKN